MMSAGIFINWLLLPLFIWEINKSRRSKKFQGVGFITVKSFACSPKQVEEICWRFGVPTHLIDLQENKQEKFKLSTFCVPKNQHFFADVVLRQNQGSYSVESKPVKQGNQLSHHYQNKRYKPIGVKAIPKSWFVRIALLFGENK